MCSLFMVLLYLNPDYKEQFDIHHRTENTYIKFLGQLFIL